MDTDVLSKLNSPRRTSEEAAGQRHSELWREGDCGEWSQTRGSGGKKDTYGLHLESGKAMVLSSSHLNTIQTLYKIELFALLRNSTVDATLCSVVVLLIGCSVQ